ncbi:reverse transcriptase domain-containing protein, partial [Tanacetum coccineum]
NAVKGQVLADFLNEVSVRARHLEVCSLTKDENSEEWTLFTDGVSSLKGAKYAVELGAYNITYMPLNAVKGQVLADFLNEVSVRARHLEVCSLTKDENLEEWTLFTDGVSSLKGAGAEKMKVQVLKVTVDSKLVACQLNEEFVASSDGMAKYLAKAKELSVLFKKFSIENVPRNLNQKADVLSKLASVAFNHLTKEILVEVLNAKSVEAREMNVITSNI